MQANSKITISKRIIVVILVAVLALSAFNTYMILERPSFNTNAVSFDFVLSQNGNNYQLKNIQTGETTGVSRGSVSSAINSALARGLSVYLNAGTYALNKDILLSNKIDAKIVGNGATIIGNGHKIIVYGYNFTHSQYATVSGLTIINGTLRIENSFGTTVSDMIFENTSVGIELANTNTWSEDTQIDNCYFINATQGIVFESPTGNATGSYASSTIQRCFFNIRDNSVGINVQSGAQFSDSQIQNVRMWLGQDGVTNQTGLFVNGSMYQTLLTSVVFESFTNVPNDMFAIDLGRDCNPVPMFDGDVNFLGSWTANIHNPYSIWISGVDTAFEKLNVNVPVGVNGHYGANATIQASPLNIYMFEPKIQTEGSFANNQTVTVRVRLLFADNVISNPVTQTFTSSGAVWLSNDQILTLFPSQSVVVGIVFDAQSSAGTTDASVTVSGYGTAG
jgi:hypothetical protein